MDTWSLGGLRKVLDDSDGLPVDEFCEPRCFKKALILLGLDHSDYPIKKYSTSTYLNLLHEKGGSFDIWTARSLRWSMWRISLWMRFRRRIFCSPCLASVNIAYFFAGDLYPLKNELWWHAILILRWENGWMIWDPLSDKDISLSGFYAEEDCCKMLSKMSAIISVRK
jgi:hypothetical protein